MKQEKIPAFSHGYAILTDEVAPEVVAETPVMKESTVAPPVPAPAKKDARSELISLMIEEVDTELQTSPARGELQRCKRALEDALHWNERKIAVINSD